MSVNAGCSGSSVSWLLSELEREQKIASAGRGVYIRVKEENRKTKAVKHEKKQEQPQKKRKNEQSL